MGLMTRGQTMLNRALGVAAGVALTYTRGVTTFALVGGWAGQEQPDTVLELTQGTRVSDKERDYQIPLSVLLAGGLGEPAEGDRITETINGVATVWQVYRKDRADCWRWSDPSTRTRFRIHTRRA